MMKLFFVSVFVLFLIFSAFSTTYAASPSVAASYIKSINSVRASFTNLKGVSKVSYTLMYNGNGIGQGVMGSFAPGKKTSFSRDFFLGTCSARVCVTHKNIKNIVLEVVMKFTNGKSTTKTYKVK